MASNATAEHVAVVLKAFAEEFLVDVRANHEHGLYYIEYNDLAHFLINSPKSTYQSIADHINSTSE